MAALFLTFVLVLPSGYTAPDNLTQLEIYTESLCPDCEVYITQVLSDAWDCDMWRSTVNITIYPYGNANEKEKNGTWQFKCQYGDEECDGNMIETCFINSVNFNQSKYLDFMIAYESALAKDSKDPYLTAQVLLETSNNSYEVSWNDLSDCIGTSGVTGGKTGNAYQHQMALWTKEVGHKYTPWIVLNGNHSRAIQHECQNDTMACTCNANGGSHEYCAAFRNRKGLLKTTNGV